MIGRRYRGVRNGVPFVLVHARVCDVLVVPLRSAAWHLYLSGDYQGYFRTERQALAHIDAARP